MMAVAAMSVQVEKVDDSTFQVTVSARTTTTHTITVSPEYYEKLTSGRMDAEALVAKSFEFLLEREPNTSILGRFDLPLISRYFPEYEGWIRRALG